MPLQVLGCNQSGLQPNTMVSPPSQPMQTCQNGSCILQQRQSRGFLGERDIWVSIHIAEGSTQIQTTDQVGEGGGGFTSHSCSRTCPPPRPILTPHAPSHPAPAFVSPSLTSLPLLAGLLQAVKDAKNVLGPTKMLLHSKSGQYPHHLNMSPGTLPRILCYTVYLKRLT